jgi:hypothetical protein
MGLCEHGNKPLGSIKVAEFLDERCEVFTVVKIEFVTFWVVVPRSVGVVH